MMAGSAKIVRAGNGTLQLQGTVNFHSVASLYEEFKQTLVPGVNHLDCQGIRESDSSAISLLLACRRLALEREINLGIVGMGDQLLSLARLYEVEELLIWQPGTGDW